MNALVALALVWAWLKLLGTALGVVWLLWLALYAIPSRKG